MRKLLGIAFALLLLFALAGCGGQPASQKQDNSKGQNPPAQTAAQDQQPKVLALGNNPTGTLINSLGTGIATLLTKTMGIQVKSVALNGPQEWMPMLGTGEMDLGILNCWDAEKGWKGEETYGPISNNKGFPISLITSGHKSQIGILVANNSSIKKGSDLKGKKFVRTIIGTPGITLQNTALLANFGLSESDIIDIKVPNITAAVQAVETGQADATGVALGTPQIQELDASSKGARFLSLDPSPEAVKRMTDLFPGKVVQVLPGPGNAGIRENTNLLEYDFYLVGRSNLSEATVYEIVKNLWDNNKELTAINNNLKDWTTDHFVVDNFTIPYHPGAIKFYKEKGLWTSALEQRQQELLALKSGK